MFRLKRWLPESPKRFRIGTRFSMPSCNPFSRVPEPYLVLGNGMIAVCPNSRTLDIAGMDLVQKVRAERGVDRLDAQRALGASGDSLSPDGPTAQ